ncbi:uncharacterized protein LOC124440690 isoform X2 [Xenia sp. Carnegie-2017]|uniref:uncharacterized protein LOC124440690 isoform X2 n=1 Tax=Xenia sp. Carnegie-2017 TaxID=2897299 RepID=UPI001F04DB44|nr:uncharacterized protein LOC124440690 isoform X2 [Xenia sp. Carnegie-2017]
MDVNLAFKLLFVLNLFSLVISEHRWFVRNSIPGKRRNYMFRLSPKHPNAGRHKVEENSRKRYLYSTNNMFDPEQGFIETYYQQLSPNNKYSGYPYPQIQYGAATPGPMHDPVYDDILQEVSKPIRIGNTIIPPYHREDRLQDQTTNSIEEAAKLFHQASTVPKSNDYETSNKKRRSRKKLKAVNEEHYDRKPQTKEDSKDTSSDLANKHVKTHKLKYSVEETKEKQRIDDEKPESIREINVDAHNKQIENKLRVYKSGNKQTNAKPKHTIDLKNYEVDEKESKKKQRKEKNTKKHGDDEMNSNYRADTWVEEDVPTSDENNGLI